MRGSKPQAHSLPRVSRCGVLESQPAYRFKMVVMPEKRAAERGRWRPGQGSRLGLPGWLSCSACITKGMGCSQAICLSGVQNRPLSPVLSPPWDWAEIPPCLRDPPQVVSHLPGSGICCLHILDCRRQVQGALNGPAWIWCLLLSSPLFYYPYTLSPGLPLYHSHNTGSA